MGSEHMSGARSAQAWGPRGRWETGATEGTQGLATQAGQLRPRLDFNSQKPTGALPSRSPAHSPLTLCKDKGSAPQVIGGKRRAPTVSPVSHTGFPSRSAAGRPSHGPAPRAPQHPAWRLPSAGTTPPPGQDFLWLPHLCSLGTWWDGDGSLSRGLLVPWGRSSKEGQAGRWVTVCPTGGGATPPWVAPLRLCSFLGEEGAQPSLLLLFKFSLSSPIKLSIFCLQVYLSISSCELPIPVFFHSFTHLCNFPAL